jgi:hypothetical protein
MEASEKDQEQLESDASDAVVELDEVLNRPGTYFNPQNELLVIVDDSAELAEEVFNFEAYEGAEWVRISDDIPVDDQQRDVMLEEFQTHYHPGSGGSVSETALEQGDEEQNEGEEGQEVGRED